MIQHAISPQPLTLKDLEQLVREEVSLSISEDSQTRINKCREYLDKKLNDTTEPLYGINTGFGSDIV